jgi:hypothetical protein
MVLEGFDIAALRGTETAGDTTWTREQHSVTGIASGDVLRVV